VLLWRPAELEFRLLVRLSYVAYLQTWLNDASPEYGHMPMASRPLGEHDNDDRTPA
jgi:hypothetical protein